VQPRPASAPSTQRLRKPKVALMRAACPAHVVNAAAVPQYELLQPLLAGLRRSPDCSARNSRCKAGCRGGSVRRTQPSCSTFGAARRRAPTSRLSNMGNHRQFRRLARERIPKRK
jgi:hypothetical protein